MIKYFLLLLSATALAQTDGPAALPRRTMETRMRFTPSSNLPKYVGPTDSLAAALAAAVPGDRIIVDPKNTTNVTVALVLPTGACPRQWVTVETSDITFLPDEFTQLSPSFAAHMPKINMMTQNASLTGGNCLRLIGFEITRPAGSGIVYNLYKNVGNDIILDRVWMHGTATDETNRGVILNNSTDVAVINSYFSDFHCFALVGKCGDSQAISGDGGTVPSGNYKIVNNYLEAAAENILFGGGPSTVVPTDITVQYNILNKPMSWNPLDPTYAPATAYDGKPHPWIVKNHFELKNGARVLFEGNRMTNVWGGFTQVGASVLLTAKNQAGAQAGVNQCPNCAVTDVTVRYNYGSYVGQALQVGCGPNAYGAMPAACGNYSIHDNVFDHGQYKTCSQCGSFFVQLAGGSAKVPFMNVSIVKNTFAVDGWLNLTTAPGNGQASNAYSFLNTGTPVPTTASNWHVDNNVFDPGRFGVYSTGGGPAVNCWTAQGISIKVRVPQCWGPGSTMTGNYILQQFYFSGAYAPWPDGNTMVPHGKTPELRVGVGANQSALSSALANHH